MSEKALSHHPRLYVGAAALAQLAQPPRWPALQSATEKVAADADHNATLPPLSYARGAHNALLSRAREVQGRIVTLLVRWYQTGHSRFRDAAVTYVRQMGEWEYWSWIAMRAGDAAPDAIFDLSYGENCATLAIAYDWLFDTLSVDEKADFHRIVRERAFLSGLKHARPGGAWWFGKPDSNWNTVCAGGLGMLALAVADEVPEAQELLPLVELSVDPYMRHLATTDGAWPEGIGYWNYGMRYAFMYLLSHERATGLSHPLLDLDGTRKTLAFPLDFCPKGQPCSFGDVNRWSPFPVHYAVAQRVAAEEICAALEARVRQQGIATGGWPHAAEWLVLHPGEQLAAPEPDTGSEVRLYRGLDWGILKDADAEPPLYLTVRGGTTDVPHGHRDLLSFHCVVGNEKLISNLSPDEYLDTTFSPRREELFEITPASKNTILINGVGIASGSALDSTDIVQLPGAEGLRLEATSAMSVMRDGPAALFCGRLFLLLDEHALLIIDRAMLPHPGRIESRMHTFADVRQSDCSAVLRGAESVLSVAYAATVPALLVSATTAPTTPTTASATVLRWCTEGSDRQDITLATLLSPGSVPAGVEVRRDGEVVRIDVEIGGACRSIVLQPDLFPVNPKDTHEA